MVQDLYIRTYDDPKYNPTTIDISDEYEMLYTKIMMILGTRAGDVLGDPEFGVSLEDKLFSFGLDEDAIKREIHGQLLKYIPESGNFDISIDVKRFKGTTRDIIVLDFIIDGTVSFGVMIK